MVASVASSGCIAITRFDSAIDFLPEEKQKEKERKRQKRKYIKEKKRSKESERISFEVGLDEGAGCLPSSLFTKLSSNLHCRCVNLPLIAIRYQ